MTQTRAVAIIGIDEVGRGPLAGPVSVGAALVPGDFNWDLLPGVNDSKKLSAAAREVVYERALALRRAGEIDFVVASVSATVIDAKGIAPAIQRALAQALKTLVKRSKIPPSSLCLKLDGGLKAPPDFLHQETIIKGDQKEPVIGLASIVAKVTRDHQMEKLSLKPDLAQYDFATHKGYGTKEHRAAILEFGLSKEHRWTFCRRILGK